MALAPLPEEILDRFRTSSRNRLTQVEAAWKAFCQGVGTDEMGREMHRNVHTLKGDARMVQFHDIDLLCQKLEDLLSVAHSRRYQVSADFDLVVSMALNFIGILLRRRSDQSLGGINVQGFSAEVARVLAEEASGGSAESVPSLGEVDTPALDTVDRLSERTRGRLARAATNIFLEYLSASGSARTRLRGAWTDLQRQIERFHSEPVTPLLERHSHAAAEVASALGLQAGVTVEIGEELRVSTACLEALDVALTHAIRNALSHGIEAPHRRIAKGKDGSGRLEIKSSMCERVARVTVRDDGRGIDMEEVRRHAIATGAMHPDVARDADRSALLELLFQPRFSTRQEADEVAGRGIGLDATRSAVRKAGGDVRIDGSTDRGTTLCIEMPLVQRLIDIHAFDAFGGRLVLAVSSDWQASWRELKRGDDPIDPIARLQIRRPEDDTGLVAAGRPQILRLQRGAEVVELVGTKSSRMLAASRICPTPSSFPVEVVTVDGAEVLLLRPDKLPVPVPESSEW